MTEPDVIDTKNDCAVGVGVGGLIHIGLAYRSMGHDKALRLAAWIVALSGATDEEFARVLDAVRST